MIEDPLQDEFERLRRIQTYIAQMGMSVGFVWNQWSVEARAAVNEFCDGLSGINRKVVEWATEFDAAWEQREAIMDPDRIDDFDDQIAAYVDTRIKTLLAEARLS